MISKAICENAGLILNEEGSGFGQASGRIHVLWVGYVCIFKVLCSIFFIKFPYVEVIRVQLFIEWSVGFCVGMVWEKKELDLDQNQR